MRTVTKDELLLMIEACLRPLQGLRVLVVDPKLPDPTFGIIHGICPIGLDAGEICVKVSLDSGVDQDAWLDRHIANFTKPVRQTAGAL